MVTLTLPGGCVKYDTISPEAGGQGDRPRISVSRFGDIRLISHGVCLRAPANTSYPYEDRQLIYTSADNGASFDGGVKSSYRADPYRSDSNPGRPSSSFNEQSDAIYDEADSRLVSVETNVIANNGPGPASTPTRMFVLGNDVANEAAGMLSSAAGLAQYDAYPTVVQRARGSFAAAWLQRPGDTIRLRTFDCPQCALGAVHAASNWTPEITLPDAEPAEFPELVSGPAGTFLFYYTLRTHQAP